MSFYRDCRELKSGSESGRKESVDSSCQWDNLIRLHTKNPCVSEQFHELWNALSTDYTELTTVEYGKTNHLIEYATENKKDRENFLPIDALSYEVTSREIIELGTAVWFEKQLCFVYEVHSFLEKGELLHRYLLRTKGAFGCSRKNNKHMIGASLDATVLDIKQDKSKGNHQSRGKTGKTNSRMVSFSMVYSSPDGTGWFCMPEIGDQMRLYFPNEIEKNAYVISAVQEEISEAAAQAYQAQPQLL